MAQYYSDPSRESDPHALPDVEVFYMSAAEIDNLRADALAQSGRIDDGDTDTLQEPGWYYWYCLPGCLPDGDANGPYDTEQAAVAAMLEEAS